MLCQIQAHDRVDQRRQQRQQVAFRHLHPSPQRSHCSLKKRILHSKLNRYKVVQCSECRTLLRRIRLHATMTRCSSGHSVAACAIAGHGFISDTFSISSRNVLYTHTHTHTHVRWKGSRKNKANPFCSTESRW